MTPEVPQENYLVQKPVFFAGCKFDPICLAAPVLATIDQICPKNTVHVFDSDHWLPIGGSEELNAKLLAWVETFDTV